jgi:hypothetical protein
MGRKYLDDIGEDYSWVWKPEGSERDETFEKEREIYGFDSRETWSLDHVFYMWLYERLKMFVEIGGQVVDLNYNKFDFKGKEYTQLELINMMIERLESYFKKEDLFVSSEEEYEPIKEIGEIWALVLSAMWW